MEERKEYVIDRFEGKYGVCQDKNGKMADIPKAMLPPKAREGSKIKETESGFVLVSSTLEKEKIKTVFEALFRDEKEPL